MTEGIPYLVLIVQSNVADAVTVTDRITAFVDKIVDDVLTPLTEEQFDSFVVGLVRSVLIRCPRLAATPKLSGQQAKSESPCWPHVCPLVDRRIPGRQEAGEGQAVGSRGISPLGGDLVGYFPV